MTARPGSGEADVLGWESIAPQPSRRSLVALGRRSQPSRTVQNTILVSIWNVLGNPRVPGMLPKVSDP